MSEAHWTGTEFLRPALGTAAHGGRSGRNLAERDAMRARLLRQMDDVPLLLMPAVRRPRVPPSASAAGTAGEKEIGLFQAMMPVTPWNLLGLPARAVVPFALTEGGLPVGVQIVGRPYSEELILEVAVRLEEARGPFRVRRDSANDHECCLPTESFCRRAAAGCAAGNIFPVSLHAGGPCQRSAPDHHPHRLSQHRRALHRRADRLAQRGGARQNRLRPPVRTHDVPRHREIPAAKSTRRCCRRPAPHPNAFTSDDLTVYHTTFSKEDLDDHPRCMEADRFQHLKYRRAEFKTESLAVLGEYNKNSANPVQQTRRSAARNRLRPHTYKHTTMGFLKDIQDMPQPVRLQPASFSTATIGPSTRPSSWRATSSRRPCARWWRSIGAQWKRGSYKPEIPVEPPQEARAPRRWTGPAPTLPLIAIAFTRPAYTDTAKDTAALDALAFLASPRIRTCTRSW